jgi:putative hemolysin
MTPVSIHLTGVNCLFFFFDDLFFHGGREVLLTSVLVIVVLIMLNAYFAGSEMALVSINETKIRMMIESGNKKAESVKNMLSEPSKFLSTIQIGITLAGFLSSAFASEAFADRLVEWILTRGIGIKAAVMKPVAVVVNNLYPFLFYIGIWRIGTQTAGHAAMQRSFHSRIVGPLRFLSVITSPIVKLLTVSTNFFVKLAGGNP